MRNTSLILLIFGGLILFAGCTSSPENKFVGCWATTVLGLEHKLVINSDGTCEAYATYGLAPMSATISWCEWELMADGRIKMTAPSRISGEPREAIFSYNNETGFLTSSDANAVIVNGGEVSLRKVKC